MPTRLVSVKNCYRHALLHIVVVGEERQRLNESASYGSERRRPACRFGARSTEIFFLLVQLVLLLRVTPSSTTSTMASMFSRSASVARNAARRAPRAVTSVARPSARSYSLLARAVAPSAKAASSIQVSHWGCFVVGKALLNSPRCLRTFFPNGFAMH